MSSIKHTPQPGDLVSLGDEEQAVEVLAQSVLLIGPMWAELVKWTRDFLLRPEFPLASTADIDIPSCVDSAAEAIALIRRQHERWIAASAGGR